MKRQNLILLLWVSLLIVITSGCATLPSGPSVAVLPAQGKPFEVFQAEDVECRQWAAQQIGMSPQEAGEQSVATGAVVGTVIGTGIGALMGAASGHMGAGAAFGAGSGLLIGSSAGADTGRIYGREAQRRYDMGYMQCMYAKGNQIPTQRSYRMGGMRAPQQYIAPPPTDYPDMDDEDYGEPEDGE